ncbi:MAG: hypothetical protein ACRDD1_21285, partial [Planctomycetia bacterium]
SVAEQLQAKKEWLGRLEESITRNATDAKSDADRLTAQHAETKSAGDQAIAALRTESEQEKTDLRRELASLKSVFEAGVASLRSETDQKLQALRQEAAEVDGKLKATLDRLEGVAAKLTGFEKTYHHFQEQAVKAIQNLQAAATEQKTGAAAAEQRFAEHDGRLQHVETSVFGKGFFGRMKWLFAGQQPTAPGGAALPPPEEPKS